MITQVRALFGEKGLNKLIAAREQENEAAYRAALAGVDAGASQPLTSRVQALALARDAEGYMAETEIRPDGSLLLIENHCPICAAATSCQGFCRSELQVFQRVLGDDCAVERAEHLLSGARRCVYLIRPVR
jgi:predicted ArsR family transcriptional regulator